MRTYDHNGQYMGNIEADLLKRIDELEAKVAELHEVLCDIADVVEAPTGCSPEQVEELVRRAKQGARENDERLHKNLRACIDALLESPGPSTDQIPPNPKPDAP